MNEDIKTLLNMPHNQLRKGACIKQCILNLEGLQHRYKPIFDEDPAINSLLEQMRAEHERLSEILRKEEDVDALMEAAFREK